MFAASSFGQDSQNAAKSITITVNTGRPLAEVLEHVQQHFLSPITFEEAPYESQQDLSKVTILQNGTPKVLLARQPVEFTFTLESSDSTPYSAAESVLGAYIQAGLPGVYNVVQENNRIDVIPLQVRGPNGSLRAVKPVMSSSVSFPMTTRSVVDTIALITKAIAAQSGAKVLPLNLPFGLLETVEFGATGQSASQTIEDLGVALGRTLSYQCLYDATSKTYYLNLTGVAASPVPGKITPPKAKAHPRTGTPDSPFFVKSTPNAH